MKSFIRKIIVIILTIEARIIIAKYKPFIITVTGSVGKTSTKDAIYTVLSAGALESGDTVRRSEKSLNSDFGVPLTVLGRPSAWNNPVEWIATIMHGLELIFFRSEYPSCLVLEVGADHPGDIKSLAKWLKPNIVVVTKIGVVPVHIEFFPSRDALVDEKLAFIHSIVGSEKKGWKVPGMIILPANDTEILKRAHAILDSRKGIQVNVMTYAVDGPGDVNAGMVETLYEAGLPAGIMYKLNYTGNSIPVRQLGVLGVQHVYPMLVATAVGISRGMSLTKIMTASATHKAPPGRMNLLAGINGSVIIDDSYNASPDAVEEALSVLGSINLSGTGRKIAVLGDMMELGQYSHEQHEKVGGFAAGILLQGEKNMLVTVGQRAVGIHDGAKSAGLKAVHNKSFENSIVAGPEVVKMVKKGDIVLVKGSQSPRLEKITKLLLADPLSASEVLVRQEEEWQKR